MMSLIAVVLGALTAADVEVTPLAGPAVTGKLMQWTVERVVVATPMGPRELESRAVRALSLSPPAVENDAWKGDLLVELLDGSRLRVESYVAKQGKATGVLRGGRPFDIRTRAIRSVRFRPAQPQLDEAWAAHQTAEKSGDLIVIRKTAKGSNQVTLDVQPGIIQEVAAETVQFELDGERIPVKREKLEGIVYFQPGERELADPAFRVDELGGSSWNVKSVKLEGESVVLETVAGASTTLPLNQLRKADYSAGNSTFLSDLEPESVAWTPYFESKLTGLSQWKKIRRDELAGGGKLLLDGELFEKGLAVPSRTEVTFRVPRGYRRLETQVGILDSAREYGDVKLIISGDGRKLFDERISGKDASREVALDLTGIRRLTLLVDFGENEDWSDVLVLGNARLTK